MEEVVRVVSRRCQSQSRFWISSVRPPVGLCELHRNAELRVAGCVFGS